MEKFNFEFVKKFSDELLEKGFDKQPGFFSENPRAGLNDQQNSVVDGMKHRLEKYSSQLEKGVSEERLGEIAKEVFIIANASTKSTAECLKFAEIIGINKDKNFLNNFSKDDPTLNPLNSAVAGGREKNVEDLINAGANPNQKSATNGDTVAHFAASIGVDKKMMGTLIKAGVNINAENNVGMTALDVANVSEKSGVQLAGFLEKEGGKKGSFQENFIESFKKNDPKNKEEELAEAISRTDNNSVKYLIAQGASVDVSVNGQNALQAAVNTGRDDITEEVASRAEIETKKNLNQGSDNLTQMARKIGSQQAQVHDGVDDTTREKAFTWVQHVNNQKEERQKRGNDNQKAG